MRHIDTASFQKRLHIKHVTEMFKMKLLFKMKPMFEMKPFQTNLKNVSKNEFNCISLLRIESFRRILILVENFALSNFFFLSFKSLLASFFHSCSSNTIFLVINIIQRELRKQILQKYYLFNLHTDWFLREKLVRIELKAESDFWCQSDRIRFGKKIPFFFVHGNTWHTGLVCQ